MFEFYREEEGDGEMSVVFYEAEKEKSTVYNKKKLSCWIFKLEIDWSNRLRVKVPKKWNKSTNIHCQSTVLGEVQLAVDLKENSRLTLGNATYWIKES